MCPSCASSSPVRLSPLRERPSEAKPKPAEGAPVSSLRKQESSGCHPCASRDPHRVIPAQAGIQAPLSVSLGVLPAQAAVQGPLCAAPHVLPAQAGTQAPLSMPLGVIPAQAAVQDPLCLPLWHCPRKQQPPCGPGRWAKLQNRLLGPISGKYRSPAGAKHRSPTWGEASFSCLGQCPGAAEGNLLAKERAGYARYSRSPKTPCNRSRGRRGGPRRTTERQGAGEAGRGRTATATAVEYRPDELAPTK